MHRHKCTQITDSVYFSNKKSYILKSFNTALTSSVHYENEKFPPESLPEISGLRAAFCTSERRGDRQPALFTAFITENTYHIGTYSLAYRSGTNCTVRKHKKTGKARRIGGDIHRRSPAAVYARDSAVATGVAEARMPRGTRRPDVNIKMDKLPSAGRVNRFNSRNASAGEDGPAGRGRVGPALAALAVRARAPFTMHGSASASACLLTVYRSAEDIFPSAAARRGPPARRLHSVLIVPRLES
ncbi:hypothetical protein EVAR_92229_1 [Eumeta japonica]|uniref:Uncharacterized protein n=1 Tax=Eumeta variegata TaxID=151549 RepID=A0A4C1TLY0_EUMVA|nr:hypothetical protein EVAR_92229_1 [Eumeta japonica]